MTLDEAIKHCEEKAKEKRNDYEQACAYNLPSEGCLKCAEEHEQLAKWLTDYKRLLAKEEANKPINWLDRCDDHYLSDN